MIITYLQKLYWTEEILMYVFISSWKLMKDVYPIPLVN